MLSKHAVFNVPIFQVGTLSIRETGTVTESKQGLGPSGTDFRASFFFFYHALMSMLKQDILSALDPPTLDSEGTLLFSQSSK